MSVRLLAATASSSSERLYEVICLGYLAVACDQAGGSGTVDAFRVPREMWEQTPTPPEEDGQLLVAAEVIVAWSSVRTDGGKVHLRQSTLMLEGSSLLQGLKGEFIWKGGKRDPDPAQDPQQAQTRTGHQPAPTCHLRGQQQQHTLEGSDRSPVKGTIRCVYKSPSVLPTAHIKVLRCSCCSSALASVSKHDPYRSHSHQSEQLISNRYRRI